MRFLPPERDRIGRRGRAGVGTANKAGLVAPALSSTGKMGRHERDNAVGATGVVTNELPIPKLILAARQGE